MFMWPPPNLQQMFTKWMQQQIEANLTKFASRAMQSVHLKIQTCEAKKCKSWKTAGKKHVVQKTRMGRNNLAS